MFETHFSSPIGEIYLKSEDGESLSAVLVDIKPNKPIFNDNLPVFKKVKKMLMQYFDGQKVDFSSVKLSYKVSPFREAVWKELQKIPYGKTVTYGEIAKNIKEKFGKAKMSAQAVGTAVGKNLFPIIIPCHRVVGAKGLGGYSLGIDKKIKLLKIEGVIKK